MKFAAVLAILKEYGTWALELVKNHGRKAVIGLFLVAALLTTTYFAIDYKIKQVVPPAIEKTVEEQNAAHTEKLIQSQEVYVAVKQKLRTIMRESGCEYIYLIEYHNGSENMATAFPFYKFDVTMDICKEGVPYIDSSPMKDEHIFKYDIFDNPEFTKKQFAFCDRAEFEKVDSKLYHMMQHNEDIQWIYTYNLYYNGQLMGAVLIMSYEELNIRSIINGMHEIENLFNSVK